MFKSALMAIIVLVGAEAADVRDELYEELKTAPNAMAAQQAEDDISAIWLESGSATVDILMERGLVAQAHGDSVLAREMFDRVIQIKPEYAEVWNRRAVLFLEDDNYAEALRDLNEALELEPRHFVAWVGIGAILQTLGAEKEALAAYREALKIHPNLEEAKQAVQRLAPFHDGRAL